MPNHVHVLATPAPSVSLGEVLKAMKGGSARAVNQVLKRGGKLWEADNFDRLIRNEDHFRRTWKYIEWNPVKAKLCTDPKHWGFSSAHPESGRRLAEQAASVSQTEVRESGAG